MEWCEVEKCYHQAKVLSTFVSGADTDTSYRCLAHHKEAHDLWIFKSYVYIGNTALVKKHHVWIMSAVLAIILVFFEKPDPPVGV